MHANITTLALYASEHERPSAHRTASRPLPALTPQDRIRINRWGARGSSSSGASTSSGTIGTGVGSSQGKGIVVVGPLPAVAKVLEQTTMMVQARGGLRERWDSMIRVCWGSVERVTNNPLRWYKH